MLIQALKPDILLILQTFSTEELKWTDTGLATKSFLGLKAELFLYHIIIINEGQKIRGLSCLVSPYNYCKCTCD
jgi:hypothetical protein